MTVRWKPLLILSGLFLAVALVGVVAITLTLVPRSSQGILKRARAARDASRFEDAEIYYKQVLQLEAKNAAIHQEFAGLYRDWCQHAPAEKKAGAAQLSGWTISSVRSSSTRRLKGPRHELLKDAMNEDVVARVDLLGQGVLEGRAGRPRRPFRAGGRGSRRSHAERPRGSPASQGPRGEEGAAVPAALDPREARRRDRRLHRRERAFAEAAKIGARRRTAEPVDRIARLRIIDLGRSGPRPIRRGWTARCRACSSRSRSCADRRARAGARGAASLVPGADAAGP